MIGRMARLIGRKIVLEDIVQNIRILRVKKCVEHREALPCSICEYEEFRDDGIPRSYAALKEQRRDNDKD